LGSAGQWNDLNIANSLYFIVEADIDTTSENGGGNSGGCTDTTALYTFAFNSQNYAIVKDAKDYTNAFLCANELGGYLANINSQEEQDAIWAEIANANITNANTVAPDGGGASYLWIGGTDYLTEGDWQWVGPDAETTLFWQGTASGSAVGGLYNNWGNEPDDYMGQQDGLGFALTDWPIGTAGQWNDLNIANSLYFIVEFGTDTTSGNQGGGTGGGTDSTITITSYDLQTALIYPNPSSTYFRIVRDDIKDISIINALGQEVHHEVSPSEMVRISHLPAGIYYVKLLTNENKYLINKLKVVK